MKMFFSLLILIREIHMVCLDSSGGAAVLKFKSFSQLCSYIHELGLHLCTTDYELTPMIITKYIQPETTVNASEKFSQQTDTDKYKTMKKNK